MGHRVGFSKKQMPLGKPEDTLTWRRLLGRDGCKEQMGCKPHGYRYTPKGGSDEKNKVLLLQKQMYQAWPLWHVPLTKAQ